MVTALLVVSCIFYVKDCRRPVSLLRGWDGSVNRQTLYHPLWPVCLSFSSRVWSPGGTTPVCLPVSNVAAAWPRPVSLLGATPQTAARSHQSPRRVRPTLERPTGQWVLSLSLWPVCLSVSLTCLSLQVSDFIQSIPGCENQVKQFRDEVRRRISFSRFNDITFNLLWSDWILSVWLLANWWTGLPPAHSAGHCEDHVNQTWSRAQDLQLNPHVQTHHEPITHWGHEPITHGGHEPIAHGGHLQVTMMTQTGNTWYLTPAPLLHWTSFPSNHKADITLWCHNNDLRCVPIMTFTFYCRSPVYD